MEKQQLLKSYPSLPIVQQASHFHPYQPALAYHQIRAFCHETLSVKPSKHILVILSTGSERHACVTQVVK